MSIENAEATYMDWQTQIAHAVDFAGRVQEDTRLRYERCRVRAADLARDVYAFLEGQIDEATLRGSYGHFMAHDASNFSEPLPCSAPR